MGAVISLLSSPVIGAIVASIVVVVATTAFLYFKYRGDDSSDGDSGGGLALGKKTKADIFKAMLDHEDFRVILLAFAAVKTKQYGRGAVGIEVLDGLDSFAENTKPTPEFLDRNLNLCYYADDKNRLKPQKLHIKNLMKRYPDDARRDRMRKMIAELDTSTYTIVSVVDGTFILDVQINFPDNSIERLIEIGNRFGYESFDAIRLYFDQGKAVPLENGTPKAAQPPTAEEIKAKILSGLMDVEPFRMPLLAFAAARSRQDGRGVLSIASLDGLDSFAENPIPTEGKDRKFVIGYYAPKRELVGKGHHLNKVLEGRYNDSGKARVIAQLKRYNPRKSTIVSVVEKGTVIDVELQYPEGSFEKLADMGSRLVSTSSAMVISFDKLREGEYDKAIVKGAA